MTVSPKVSVIVSMYNTEAYLGQCVGSIRRQTLEDIEIILVDDGSLDRCGSIADEYATLDSRIKVVHRANGGLGPARNSGIEVATGEYVGFVDSDDWIEPGMYERLLRAASSVDADIAFGGMKTMSFGKAMAIHCHPFAGRVFRGKDDIFALRRSFYGAGPERVGDDPVPVSVWLALYKRTFLLRHRLSFMNVRSEDKFFNTHACRCAESVICVGGSDYCYRKESQPSITETFEHGTIDSFFQLFRLLEQTADEEADEFRDICLLRTKRCIIDYSRVLVGMIEKSSEDDALKRAYIAKVVNHSALRRALVRYPFWKLPTAQAVFFLALKCRSIALVRLLISLRGRKK